MIATKISDADVERSSLVDFEDISLLPFASKQKIFQSRSRSRFGRLGSIPFFGFGCFKAEQECCEKFWLPVRRRGSGDEDSQVRINFLMDHFPNGGFLSLATLLFNDFKLSCYIFEC